ETRARLAAKAFAHTARYDATVAGYLSAEHPEPDQGLPATLQLMLEKAQDLRYGENPHQRAALYREPAARGAGVAASSILQGKDLSFNNIADADAAIECVRQFADSACVIVKHANPCGAALGRRGTPDAVARCGGPLSRRARGAHAPQAERGGARGSHLRLAGVQVREIQRHRLRARRGHHRHRRRSDEPRVLDSARGDEGRG